MSGQSCADVVRRLPSLAPGRFDDEPARHKLLDCIGDLALAGTRSQVASPALTSRDCAAGHPIYGTFKAELPSHKLSHELLGALLSDPANFEVGTI